MAKEKIGRNDPCPCGSGKKYKKCCFGKLDRNNNIYLNSKPILSILKDNNELFDEKQKIKDYF